MIAGLPKRMLLFERPLPVALLAPPEAAGFLFGSPSRIPVGKIGPRRRKGIAVFIPVNITPLARRGSPLALILRGILVAAVVMALLATLAAYPFPRDPRGTGSWRDAGSPYRIPWEETLGAPPLSPLQTKQTSTVAQPPEGSDYGEDSPPSSTSHANACPTYADTSITHANACPTYTNTRLFTHPYLP